MDNTQPSAKDNQVLADDEFWIIKRFGPRYYTAHRKTDDEHRIYYSYDALERDFYHLIHNIKLYA